MKKILIVKFGALGDVIRTSYILPGIHDRYGESYIYWLTTSSSFDLLRFNPYVHEIITPEHNRDKLHEVEFDLILSLDDETFVLQMISQLHCKELIGAYLDQGMPAYEKKSSAWFDMGLISKYGKEKADELKKKNIREHNKIFETMLSIEIKEPLFYNSSIIEQQAAKRFTNGYFNIGLNSGAGSRWTSKQLQLEETIALIKRLLATRIGGKDVRVYLLGGKEEAERHRAIRSLVPSEALIDLGNDNALLEFAALIRNCHYVITSDSLSLHLAISQKIPNLSFYAPTSAAEIGTFGTGVKVLSIAQDYCSYLKNADNSSITAARIMQGIREHLGNVHEQ